MEIEDERDAIRRIVSLNPGVMIDGEYGESGLGSRT